MIEKRFYIVKDDENVLIAVFRDLEDCQEFIDDRLLELSLHYDEVVI